MIGTNCGLLAEQGELGVIGRSTSNIAIACSEKVRVTFHRLKVGASASHVEG